MRDTVAHIGGDINKINPLIPIDLIIDHSIQGMFIVQTMLNKKNAELEIKCNIN